eukprot:6720844-Pyramimonas_sp.AAC.3
MSAIAEEDETFNSKDTATFTYKGKEKAEGREEERTSGRKFKGTSKPQQTKPPAPPAAEGSGETSAGGEGGGHRMQTGGPSTAPAPPQEEGGGRKLKLKQFKLLDDEEDTLMAVPVSGQSHYNISSFYGSFCANKNIFSCE